MTRFSCRRVSVCFVDVVGVGPLDRLEPRLEEALLLGPDFRDDFLSGTTTTRMVSGRVAMLGTLAGNDISEDAL